MDCINSRHAPVQTTTPQTSDTRVRFSSTLNRSGYDLFISATASMLTSILEYQCFCGCTSDARVRYCNTLKRSGSDLFVSPTASVPFSALGQHRFCIYTTHRLQLCCSSTFVVAVVYWRSDATARRLACLFRISRFDLGFRSGRLAVCLVNQVAPIRRLHTSTANAARLCLSTTTIVARCIFIMTQIVIHH